MGYEICSICGKFFNRNGQACCDECQKKDQIQYALVKDYITKHMGATTLDVTKETGVSIKAIQRYIKQGTIQYVEKVV